MTPADEWAETREAVAAAIHRAMQDGQGENDVIALAADSILKLIEAARQSDGGWQPIETAPRDGTLVWLGRRYSLRVGFWATGKDYEHKGTVGGGWRDFNVGRDLAFEPTYWQPVPDAPKEATPPLASSSPGMSEANAPEQKPHHTEGDGA